MPEKLLGDGEQYSESNLNSMEITSYGHIHNQEYVLQGYGHD